MAPIVTQNIVDALARFAPDRRAEFEKNRQAFLSRLDEAMARWTRAMEPFKGAKVVVYHPQWIYLLTPIRAAPGGGARGPAGHPGVARSPDTRHPSDER